MSKYAYYSVVNDALNFQANHLLIFLYIRSGGHAINNIYTIFSFVVARAKPNCIDIISKGDYKSVTPI